LKYRTIGVLLTAALLLLLTDARGQETGSAPLSDRDGHHSCLVSKLYGLTKPDPMDLKSFYVVPDSGDDGSAHSFVADSLLQLGFTVHVGNLEDMPNGVDVLVYSRSHWVWDVSTYLRDLIVIFRTPTTNELIGIAHLNPFPSGIQLRVYGPNVPHHVNMTVQDLLNLLDDPEEAPPC